jgi:hypothetical protein
MPTIASVPPPNAGRPKSAQAIFVVLMVPREGKHRIG